MKISGNKILHASRTGSLPKPALILWGMKDIAFRERELNRWEGLLTNSRTIRYEDAGHFVLEEKGNELNQVIGEFMKGA